MNVLETEHDLVFNHHLGVHSGTAVMEDLLARKLWELCNRAHTLITMKDNCMDIFLRFCESLTPEKRNRMLTAFVVFEKGDLLDYMQLVKPHLVHSSRIMTPLSSVEQHAPAFWTSTAGQQQIVAGDVNRPGVLRSTKLAPFVTRGRVEALREAGHPFLKIVDKLIEAYVSNFSHTAACSQPELVRLCHCCLFVVLLFSTHIMLLKTIQADQ